MGGGEGEGDVRGGGVLSQRQGGLGVGLQPPFRKLVSARKPATQAHFFTQGIASSNITNTLLVHLYLALLARHRHPLLSPGTA